jgi:hypothetical protein
VPGGSANSYDYVNQDPVDNLDLDGRMCWWSCVKHHVQHAAGKFDHAIFKYAVDVAATVPYGVYLDARFMHSHSGFSRGAWHDVESWGIHTDMAMDRYKIRHGLGERSDYDEGPGSTVYLNPLHGLTKHFGFQGPAWHNAPGAWIGRHGERRIDW